MDATFEAIKREMREAGLPEGVGEGVAFPCGAKIVEIEGKPMLQAMSPEEWRQLLVRAGEVSTEAEAMAVGTCTYSMGFCYSSGCNLATHYCKLVHVPLVGYGCACRANGT